MKLERDFLILGVLVIICMAVFSSLESAREYGAASVTGILPNTALTPGAINPDITQENISQTICNKNWSTSSIRPSSSFTTALKIKQIAQYGYSDTKPADYEEDHLISLELGGNPTDPKNLWPEPYAPVPGAKQKDLVENYLHAQVCSGAITLAQAQKEISQNWYAVYTQISGAHAAGGTALSDDDPDDE